MKNTMTGKTEILKRWVASGWNCYEGLSHSASQPCHCRMMKAAIGTM